MHRRAFRKAADELVEEFFGGYLQLKGISAVFDAYI
jgi:hypothetical protein